MGLGEFVKKQFIDVIQWTEKGDEVLAWRFLTADLEIQQGAQLTVRETQMAVFVDEGRVADCFGPGRHRVHTRTLPLLTKLRQWNKLFESAPRGGACSLPTAYCSALNSSLSA